MSQMPIFLAILVGVGVGALAGLVNGTIIVTTGVPAFIVTMGMMGIAKGVSLIIGAGKDMSIFPKTFTMIGTGLRWPGIIFAACVLLIFFHPEPDAAGLQRVRHRGKQRRLAPVRRQGQAQPGHLLRHRGLPGGAGGGDVHGEVRPRHSQHGGRVGAAGHRGRRHRWNESLRRQGRGLPHGGGRPDHQERWRPG